MVRLALSRCAYAPGHSQASLEDGQRVKQAHRQPCPFSSSDPRPTCTDAPPRLAGHPWVSRLGRGDRQDQLPSTRSSKFVAFPFDELIVMLEQVPVQPVLMVMTL